MTELDIKPDEYDAIVALCSNFEAFTAMFSNGEHSAPALRMVIASLRHSVDVLEQIASRWEQVG